MVIPMSILVHFKNSNVFDYIENRELDTLIAKKAIYAFVRASGWVNIARDPIRRTGVRKDYKGPERRAGLMK